MFFRVATKGRVIFIMVRLLRYQPRHRFELSLTLGVGSAEPEQTNRFGSQYRTYLVRSIFGRKIPGRLKKSFKTVEDVRSDFKRKLPPIIIKAANSKKNAKEIRAFRNESTFVRTSLLPPTSALYSSKNASKIQTFRTRDEREFDNEIMLPLFSTGAVNSKNKSNILTVTDISGREFEKALPLLSVSILKSRNQSNIQNVKDDSDSESEKTLPLMSDNAVNLNNTKTQFDVRLRQLHDFTGLMSVFKKLKFRDVVDYFNKQLDTRVNSDVNMDGDAEATDNFVAQLTWRLSRQAGDTKEGRIEPRIRRNAQNEEEYDQVANEVDRDVGTDAEAEEEYIIQQKYHNWTHFYFIMSTIIIVWVCWFLIAIGLCRQAASMSKKAALMNEA